MILKESSPTILATVSDADPAQFTTYEQRIFSVAAVTPLSTELVPEPPVAISATVTGAPPWPTGAGPLPPASSAAATE